MRRRDEVESDLEEEIRVSFEMLVERRVAQGMSRKDAIRATRIAFEGEEQIKHRVREVRVGTAIETFLSDLRIAARMLWRDPGFTFFAVLTLALALGANAAIFSLVDAVLIKAVGYPEPERIVQIWEKPPGGTRNGIAPANYIDWTRLSTSFEAMAAVSGAGMSYLPLSQGASTVSGGPPVSLRVGVVSAPYFDVFGVKPSLGRTFRRNEDEPGNSKVVVFTHRVWTNLLGGDPNALGREVLLNGERYTVIGVLPGASQFDRDSTDVWVPLVFPSNPARDYHSFGAVARLKRGVSFEQAQAEMSSIAAGIAERYPAIKKDWGATVDRFLDRLVSPQLQLSLKVLMWAVIAVLLIGCANLTNLLMARATLRSREIAVRLALGAGRGRMIRMLLTESMIISACGAVAGLALGYGLLRWVQSLMPPYYLPSEAEVSMDGRVLLFLAAATVFTCIAVGLVPAFQASSRNSAEALKEGGRSNTLGRAGRIARNAFVGAQVAIALLLLVGASLLTRSFQRILDVPMGYKTEGLIAAYLPLPMERNPEAASLTRYIDRILEEVRAVPGVQEAAVTTGLPLRGWGDGMPMYLPDKPDTKVGTGFKIVTPGYFRALGLVLKAGRYLDERDTTSSPAVVVVNESFVRRYFDDGNALGKRILVEKILPTRGGLGPQMAWEIVGVVVDEKGRGLESQTDIGAYASFAQDPVVGLGIVARGQGETGTLIRATAEAVARVDKTQVLERPRSVEEWKNMSLMGRRLTMSLIGGLALLALTLACAGIYGVLSFVTAQRTQELGIRAALGASRGALIQLVVRGGATPVISGIVVGLVAAVGLARFIQSMLFGVDPVDPLTLAGVSLVFGLVGFLACVVPGLKASRVDPIAALRQD